MRTCKVCGKTKKDESFNKNSSAKSGYDSACKICRRLKNAGHRKRYVEGNKSVNHIKLAAVKKSDWCKTFKLLSTMGYDITIDVHKQFVDKYGLTPKEISNDRVVVTYTYLDCLDGSDETDLLPD